MSNHTITAIVAIIILFLLTGCGKTESIQASVTQVPPTETDLPPTATQTPEPTTTSIPPTEMPTPTIAPVELIKNESYVPDGHYKQVLDIYLPTSGDGPFPTLFMVHEGGGRKEQLAFWGRTFAEKGYAAVSINHRMFPDDGYPDNVADTFCALAWVHANADTYGFDTEKIFAMGHSAGGTLIAMLGVVDDPFMYLEECPYTLPETDWVRGVIPFTGIFDYVSAAGKSPNLDEYISALMGGDQDEALDTWVEASPISWVDGSEVPFLILHGAEDNNISPAQSLSFAEALEAAGSEVELLIVPGADHRQIVSSEESIQAVDAFISNPPMAAPEPTPTLDPAVFELRSPAFGMEELIPVLYTCSGKDTSPPLEWGAPPEGTQSLVLIVEDISPPEPFVHWTIFNIPPETRSLPQGVPTRGHFDDGRQQGTNQIFKLGYFGPCPMPGPNRYRFRLYAIDIMLDLEDGVMKIPLKGAMKEHILAETELIGVFRR